MKKSERIFADIKKNRLIALLAPNSKKECVAAYEICSPSGIILEIAIRSEYAIDGIKSILNKYPDALVLAGTVMTPQQAEEAIEAGAAGVDMGRNIWQSKYPVPMIRAVRAIVHGNVNVNEAYDLFKRLCKESPSKNNKPKPQTQSPSKPKKPSKNQKQKKK